MAAERISLAASDLDNKIGDVTDHVDETMRAILHAA
jgi:hypothetical protein